MTLLSASPSPSSPNTSCGSSQGETQGRAGATGQGERRTPGCPTPRAPRARRDHRPPPYLGLNALIMSVVLEGKHVLVLLRPGTSHVAFLGAHLRKPRAASRPLTRKQLREPREAPPPARPRDDAWRPEGQGGPTRGPGLARPHSGRPHRSTRPRAAPLTAEPGAAHSLGLQPRRTKPAVFAMTVPPDWSERDRQSPRRRRGSLAPIGCPFPQSPPPAEAVRPRPALGGP